MKRSSCFFLLFFLLFSPYFLIAQTSNMWYFGKNAGINFNSDIPLALYGETNTNGGTASVCDASGNIIFYSDGLKVWDKNHQVVSGGTRLKGSTKSSQSTLIVPKPGNPSEWLLFTGNVHPDSAYAKGINYYTVSNSGDVLSVSSSKNLANANQVGEQLTGVQDGSGGYWIMTHGTSASGSNAFYAYHINNKGEVATDPVVSNIGHNFSGYIGTLKSNLCQTMLGATYTKAGVVEVYDFDKTQGKISSVVHSLSGYNRPYGLEFSPNGQFVYFSVRGNGSTLYQFDLSSGTAFTDAEWYNANKVDHIGQLQLGPDGKIYAACPSRTKIYYIGIISSPDMEGVLASYNKFGKFYRSNSVPQEGIANLGLPNILKSELGFLSLSVPNNSNFCIGTSQTYTYKFTQGIVSSAWDMGDGATSNQPSITHAYASAGNYVPTLTVTDGCGVSYSKSISVSASAKKTPSGKITCNGNQMVLTANPSDPAKDNYIWVDSLYADGSLGAFYGIGSEVTYNVNGMINARNVYVGIAGSASKTTTKDLILGPSTDSMTIPGGMDYMYLVPTYGKYTMKSFDLIPAKTNDGCAGIRFEVLINSSFRKSYYFSDAGCGAPITVPINADLISHGGSFQIRITNSNVTQWYGHKMNQMITSQGILSNEGTAQSISFIGNIQFDHESYTVNPGCSNYIKVYRPNCFIPEVSRTIPVVTTAPVTNITGVNATGGGSIISDGNSAITSKGVYCGTSSNPTQGSHSFNLMGGKGAFEGTLSNLSPNTIYYVRAYAWNDAGVGYGDQIIFKTGNVSLPEVTIAPEAIVKAEEATIDGEVTSEGNGSVSAYGICWSTMPNPTISGTFKYMGRGQGLFNAKMANLTPNTTYYVRCYATNSAGTSYSSEISFTTQQYALPVVTTGTVLILTPYTMDVNCDVQSNARLKGWGFCWSTVPNPTIADQTTNYSSYNESYISYLTGLTPNTTYYLRAYATNSVGTAYGDEIQIVTPEAFIPTLNTLPPMYVSTNSVLTGADILSDGNARIHTNGICYSTSPNPTISATIWNYGMSGSQNYSLRITGLQANTTYYARAFASNNFGTGYGNEITFTTLATVDIPLVATDAATEISSSSAKTNGEVLSDLGSYILERGICYSASSVPTIDENKISAGIQVGKFSITLNSLLPDKTYYVRAYAINSVGIAYGDVVTFTTLAAAAPSVSATNAITNITSNSATSGGIISDEEMFQYMNFLSAAADENTPLSSKARGVCWSTSPNPTILDDKTKDGFGEGAFSSELTGLMPNTTYYVKAYATNSAGTGYGNELSFTTGLASGLHLQLKNQIAFYPNPTSGILTLNVHELNSDYFEIRISDINSIIVFNQKINNLKGDYKERINLSFLSKGFYFIQINTAQGTFMDKLLISE